jgi:O-antigen/teichoic acid export membrane protein
MVVVAAQSLVLAPLFLHYLGPRLYGAWLATGEVLVWIQSFDLGLPNLLIQRIGAAHARDDRRTVAEYLAAGLLALLVVGAVLAAIALAAAPYLGAWFHLQGGEARLLTACFAVAAIATVLIVPSNAVVGFARGVQDTGVVSGVYTLSVLTSFGVTLTLLLQGWGLWAAAMGVVARVACTVVGTGWFLARHLRSGLASHFHVRRAPLAEILRISPVTAAGGLAYVGMTYSEMALVGVFAGPELVTVYGLTRRAIDLGRAIVDMIGAAAYGGFAHLSASDDRHRALDIHAQISALRWLLAIATAAAYLAVNTSLVGVWVGPAQFGGVALTAAFALQMIVGGQAYLLNYLYRATGPVAHGSMALLVEAIVRVPLMLALFWTVGLVGIPMAAVGTGAAAAVLAHRWTSRRLGRAGGAQHGGPLSALVQVALLAVALLLAPRLVLSWWYVLGTGTAMAAVGCVALAAVDPRVAGLRRDAWQTARRALSSTLSSE